MLPTILAVVNIQGVLWLSAAGVACYFLGKLFFRADTHLEDVKRRCQVLSGWCAENGLPICSKVLNAFVVNDVSGLIPAFKQVLDILADPVESQAALDRFLLVQLDKKLSTHEGKEILISAIEKRLGLKINRDALVVANESVALNIDPKVSE